MEKKAEIQKTIYDNAKSHFLGNFPDSLPIEQAYVHIGMYLGWIIDSDLYSEYFEDEASIDEIWENSLHETTESEPESQIEPEVTPK